MINVIDSPVPVEIPSQQPLTVFRAADVRPDRCPACKHPCRDGEGRLVIQSHASYTRQVLGLAPGKVLLVRVPRFLCRHCFKTTSVLPSWVHPWRWYAITAIVEILWLWDSGRATIQSLRARFGAWPEGATWTSVRRWAGELLTRPTLLGWMRLPVTVATRLGDRLHRFLFDVRPAGPPTFDQWTAPEVRACACQALAGSCHRPLSSDRARVTDTPGVAGVLPGLERAAGIPHRRVLVAS